MNFVVIMLDTLRYDYLACNGNAWIRTPNLDALAAQAVCFDRAYCGSFATIPQRTDAFTGRYGEPFHPWAPLAWDAVTLPELMRNAGYVTMLIHDTPHMVNYGFGFDRPFHGWQMIRGQEVDRYRTDPVRREDLVCVPEEMRFAGTFGAQAVRNHFDFASEEDHCTAQLFRTAARWLERNRDHEKLFLWIDSFSPHEPWDPPHHYVDLYDPGYEGPELFFPHYGSLAHLPPEQVRHMRALYAGLVTMVDRWIGYFLDQLEASGLAGETTVIVSADHGTYAGDRLLAGKGPPHYEEIGRIPLIIRRPPTNQQRRLNDLVQPADLMPTILDLAGVEAPAEARMQGVNLAPLLRGEEAFTRRVAAMGMVNMALGVGHVAITSGKWSLLDYPDAAKRQLFDLEDDPGQERNLISEEPGVADELHEACLGFLERHEATEELLAIWREGDEEALKRFAAMPPRDPALRPYWASRQRGLGLHPDSFVRTPEFGADAP